MGEYLLLKKTVPSTNHTIEWICCVVFFSKGISDYILKVVGVGGVRE